VNVEHIVRVRTDDPGHPMTLAEVEQFVAEARQAGARDGTPVTFETTAWARRSRSLTSVIDRRVQPAPASGAADLEVK
jgi:hypothetical protein